ncbi:MAG: low molecular weight protein-tyrosine-phosphatase [Phycisphaerales bacterium]|nr:low molecular weight protein-tyrosine-phosphatase [Phycisphaerales bacterium]
MADPHGVLFVCLGNICRSPLAEAIFIHRARERRALDRFDVDSAGTGHWHVGGPADPRSIAVGAKNGIAVTSIARQVDPDTDFERFATILAMDQSNEATLLEWGAPRGNVRLMREFDPSLAGAERHRLDVPDPYHGGADGFDKVFAMLDAACLGLLDQLLRGPLA